MFPLGEVGLHSRRMQGWLKDLLRYETVKFFGYARGRTFVGVLWGSEDGRGEWTLALRSDLVELADLRWRMKGLEK